MLKKFSSLIFVIILGAVLGIGVSYLSAQAQFSGDQWQSANLTSNENPPHPITTESFSQEKTGITGFNRITVGGITNFLDDVEVIGGMPINTHDKVEISGDLGIKTTQKNIVQSLDVNNSLVARNFLLRDNSGSSSTEDFTVSKMQINSVQNNDSISLGRVLCTNSNKRIVRCCKLYDMC